MPWRLASALMLSSLRYIGPENTPVIRALPCRAGAMAPPGKDDDHRYHLIGGLTLREGQAGRITGGQPKTDIDPALTNVGTSYWEE